MPKYTKLFEQLDEATTVPIKVKYLDQWNAAAKYCAPIKVQKPVVDKYYQQMLANTTKRINDFYIEIIAELDQSKLTQRFKSDLLEIKPIISNMLQLASRNALYARYSLLPEADYTKTISDVCGTLFNIFITKLNSNVMYKTALNLGVTKSNVEQTVIQFKTMFDKYAEKVETLCYAIIINAPTMYGIKIDAETTKGSKCDKVIVTTDTNNVVLTPQQQYNPLLPVITKKGVLNKPNEEDYDLDTMVKPYLSKVIQIIRQSA
jgi:hypothetical protein